MWVDLCPQGPGSMPATALDTGARGGDGHAVQEGAQALDRLAGAAAELGVAIDVLAVGDSAANLRHLSGVAARSGGSLTLHAGAAPNPPLVLGPV